MERGVEAGDRGQPGPRPLGRGDRGERLRLVERRERRQTLQLRDERGVEPRGAGAPPAVDDPMRDGVRRPELGERGAERRRVDVGAGGGGLVLAEPRVVRADQRELDAARAGVDAEDAHQRAGSVQSRTAGGSIPCSRV